MVISTKVALYTDADIAASGGRLSRCKVCGGDCFYLEIFEDSRRWWHEVFDTDYSHVARPLEGGGGDENT